LIEDYDPDDGPLIVEAAPYPVKFAAVDICMAPVNIDIR
jgi:hypothetical protein